MGSSPSSVVDGEASQDVYDDPAAAFTFVFICLLVRILLLDTLRYMHAWLELLLASAFSSSSKIFGKSWNHFLQTNERRVGFFTSESVCSGLHGLYFT